MVVTIHPPYQFLFCEVVAERRFRRAISVAIDVVATTQGTRELHLYRHAKIDLLGTATRGVDIALFPCFGNPSHPTLQIDARFLYIVDNHLNLIPHSEPAGAGPISHGQAGRPAFPDPGLGSGR